MDLATCLFAGLTTQQLQDKQYSWLDGRFVGPTQHKLFPKEVIRFVRRKELRDLPNPFNIPDEYFKRSFNMDKLLFQDFLLTLCLRTYYRPEVDTKSLPFDLRVLVALSFLRHGHIEALIPLDAFKVWSAKTLLFCVPQICQTIVNFMSPDFIVFPSNSSETVGIKHGFHSRYTIPNVVGIMDCFHIRLSKIDVSQEKAYKCRHGNLAINVQVICDHNSRFIDVNPRASGGTSDIFVWNRSHIKGVMKNLFVKEPAWLIADRGYKLDDILINPYRNPNSSSEQRLNDVFEKMLTQLDVTVVMLKSRFRCLNTILPYNHQTAANIVTSCATIHNYMLSKDYAMEDHLMSKVPRRKSLPNATFEDEWSSGYESREYIKNYLNSIN
ncbi:putative nuclease HARBI1 [Eurosta solidaginis]|uniref:putative nuclease HARBI1 n=1 Tax=Eurosta solidaginis TaxID=178769 RepID=UPI0035310470